MSLEVTKEGRFSWTGGAQSPNCALQGTLIHTDKGVQFGTQADFDAALNSGHLCATSDAPRYGERAQLLVSEPDYIVVHVPARAETNGVQARLGRSCLMLEQFVRRGSATESRIQALTPDDQRPPAKAPTRQARWLVTEHETLMTEQCSDGEHLALMTTNTDGAYAATWSDGCVESGTWAWGEEADGYGGSRSGAQFSPKKECGRLTGFLGLYSQLGYDRLLVFTGHKKKYQFILLEDPVAR